MKQTINFTKMHGCKNDYLYIDCTQTPLNDPSAVSILLSDRRTGIGGDGIILILPSSCADFRMRIFNADGSEAEMCGNGIRCVGKFVFEKGLTDKTSVTIETGTHEHPLSDEEISASVKLLDLKTENGFVTSVVVDMGKPITDAALIPTTRSDSLLLNEPLLIKGKEYPVTCINMGNPHAVTFLNEVSSLDLPSLGPKFEHHPLFPNRTNTEFIKVLNRNELEMRVWERGSGETFACGTGACAAAYAAILNGFTEDNVTVHLLGGDLNIAYDRTTGHLFMDGPATTVFNGKVEIESCDFGGFSFSQIK